MLAEKISLARPNKLFKYILYLNRIKNFLKGGKPFGVLSFEVQRMGYWAEEDFAKGKVNRAFCEFLKKNLKNINDEKDFWAFSNHFEAFYSYSLSNAQKAQK